MLWWDETIGTYANEIDQLSRAELGELACDVIEGTAELFDLPFDEFFPAQAANLIKSAIHDCRASAPGWRQEGADLARFMESLDAVQELPMRPGCGPLTMAALSLVGGLTGTLDAAVVREVMSSCYESIVMSQLTGRVTIEKERHNLRCEQAIAFQYDLVRQRS